MAEKKLQHTEGGSTTRDDAGDLGVPMLPGKPDEPVGPEDALGDGPKRGDYSDRIGPSNYHPHEARRRPARRSGRTPTRRPSPRRATPTAGSSPRASRR
jgi:hypothetical protein